MVVDHWWAVCRGRCRGRCAGQRLSRHPGRLDRHSLVFFHLLCGIPLANHKRHHVFRDAKVVQEDNRLRRDPAGQWVLLNVGQKRLVAHSALGHVHHVGELGVQIHRAGCWGRGGDLWNRLRLGLCRGRGRLRGGWLWGVKLRQVGRRAHCGGGVIVNARALRLPLASGGQCHGQH